MLVGHILKGKEAGERGERGGGEEIMRGKIGRVGGRQWTGRNDLLVQQLEYTPAFTSQTVYL